MNELALFAGAGGGILGGLLLGWRTVCAVEYDEHARNVLIARQNDGSLEPFPIWDDVRTFDGKPWRGIVDVISGGFPCQDISCAGKGAGITGERSGLWTEFARIIREVQPSFAFVENSPMLTLRGLGVVIGDLAEMGFNAEWGVVSALNSGAPHLRERIWIMAYSNKNNRAEAEFKCNRSGKRKIQKGTVEFQSWSNTRSEDRWSSEPELVRVANGMANQMDRIERIGNGQVPDTAAKAWHVLCQEIGPKKE